MKNKPHYVHCKRHGSQPGLLRCQACNRTYAAHEVSGGLRFDPMQGGRFCFCGAQLLEALDSAEPDWRLHQHECLAEVVCRKCHDVYGPHVIPGHCSPTLRQTLALSGRKGA